MKKAAKNLIQKLILSRPFCKRSPGTGRQEPWDDPFDKDRGSCLGHDEIRLPHFDGPGKDLTHLPCLPP